MASIEEKKEDKNAESTGGEKSADDPDGKSKASLGTGNGKLSRH